MVKMVAYSGRIRRPQHVLTLTLVTPEISIFKVHQNDNIM